MVVREYCSDNIKQNNVSPYFVLFDSKNNYLCIKAKSASFSSESEFSGRSAAEFKSKNQSCQLKQSFLITL
jgi:hypothetical protein